MRMFSKMSREPLYALCEDAGGEHSPLWRKPPEGELRTEPSVQEGRNDSLQAGIGGLEELRGGSLV